MNVTTWQDALLNNLPEFERSEILAELWVGAWLALRHFRVVPRDSCRIAIPHGTGARKSTGHSARSLNKQPYQFTHKGFVRSLNGIFLWCQDIVMIERFMRYLIFDLAIFNGHQIEYRYVVTSQKSDIIVAVENNVSTEFSEESLTQSKRNSQLVECY
ncbi:MAG: hypothetical protein JJU13_03920 [Balneolaceae bacterium]|nr:hypothetical protein [Balneolaceae bacterium]